MSNTYLWTIGAFCKLSGRRGVRSQHSRRACASTAMKKPSVPWRAGVSRSAARCRRPTAAARSPMPARPRLAPRQRREVRMVRQEPGDLVAVLLRQHRAGDVDQPAAGLHERRRQRQHRALLVQALGKVGRLQPPLGVRPPAPGAAAGAGRIDRTRGRSAARARPAPPHRRPAAPGRCARRPASVARRSGAGARRRRRRRRPGRCCAWLRRTPASCRRRLHKYRAPAARGPAPAISAAICEPSSCTSYQPLPWPASASTLGCRPGPSGAGRRTPSGENGVGNGEKRASAFSTFSRSALSVLTRRSTGARRASAAPSSAAACAERALRTRARANRESRRARPPAYRPAASRDKAACSASLSGSRA